MVIKSSRILVDGGMVDGWVVIRDGKIAEVVDQASDVLKTSDEVLIDAGDDIVMAGIIDPHVHINEPGRTEWEGFDTAMRAALAGGITMLVDMPLNSSPVTTNAEAFDEKIRAAEKNLHSNCGFWGGIVPGNSNHIEPLIKKGVLGFKAFLTHSGIDDFPNVTEADLRLAMPVIAAHGLPLLVHCELLPEIVDPFQVNNRSYNNYLLSRPAYWEDNAIELMISLCKEFNCRVHIVHLSSANAIKQIADAKLRGLPLTVETGQHYLYFNAEEIGDGQTEFKCAPPIRDKSNNDQLWNALESGLIDFVATDHSPCTPDLKKKETGDFMSAWGGIASIQFALPVLWTAALRRNIKVEMMGKWLSENPAILAGMQACKGRIAAGFDADIIIWDDKAEFTVSENIILHKHKLTPYLGEKLKGVVRTTILAGKIVYEEGKNISLNCGKIIRR